MSEEDEKSREIVTSYDEILEITGLLAMRETTLPRVNEDKENSDPHTSGSGSSNDDVIMPVMSSIKLQPASSLLSINEEGNNTKCRTISIAKTKNNDVGFVFVEIKQGLFVSCVNEQSSASLNRVRFGDKIQCINGIEVVSYTQAKQLIEETYPTVDFSFIDCPYREAKTVYKIRGRCGLFINDGMILDHTKYFSPKSDKIPLNYYITEIDGHSTIGVLDEKIAELIEAVNSPFILHIVPQWFYEYLVYGLDPSGNGIKKKRRYLSFSCFR
ncbi:unnamed protein product [Heterobilharzia americana]|nr:unnamed protein product [Heterobilharzia americana]CAH8622137.1 unnamed protein product [Heterobilharzia americana]